MRGEIRGAFSAEKDGLTDDEPRQFGDLENTIGRTVADHGGWYGEPHWELGGSTEDLSPTARPQSSTQYLHLVSHEKD